MKNLLNRFLAYARHDTRPDESSTVSPSSISQMLFAEKLVSELEEIGLSDISLDGNGYVMATLPANTGSVRPVIGFIAHMDTSPDAPSENISPQVHHNYRGGDITLKEEKENDQWCIRRDQIIQDFVDVEHKKFKSNQKQDKHKNCDSGLVGDVSEKRVKFCNSVITVH